MTRNLEFMRLDSVNLDPTKLERTLGISLRASWSFRALLIWRTTCVSNTGMRRPSMRKARMSCAVTSGGSSCSVSTESSRGLWRLMRSSAGASRSVDSSTVGRRYIRRRVRKTPSVSDPALYTRLQYLEAFR